MKKLALLFGLGLCLVYAAAAAETVQRIVAVVNDDVVSAYDLDQRLSIVFASTGVRDTPENRRRMQLQVLQTLIDERVQLQEAGRLNITAEEGEIERAIHNIERQNKIPRGKFSDFLSEQGISYEAVRNQISANIIWTKLVQRRIRPTVTVSDEEVAAVVDRLKASAGQKEHLLAEIFLGVSTPDQENEVRQLSERLVDQMRQGANFQAIARQFSQSVTAAVGGDMGWLLPDQLPPEVSRVVARMRPGQVSPPIRNPGGFYIIALRETRRILGGESENIELDLSQILLKLGGRAEEEEVLKQMELASTIREELTGCDGVEELGTKYGARDAGSLGRIKLTDLPEDLGAAVKDLRPGEASRPLRTGAGLHLFVVCDRFGDQDLEPNKEAIREELGNRRLSMLSRRYLRDLRREALVEVRR